MFLFSFFFLSPLQCLFSFFLSFFQNCIHFLYFLSLCFCFVYLFVCLFQICIHFLSFFHVSFFLSFFLSFFFFLSFKCPSAQIIEYTNLTISKINTPSKTPTRTSSVFTTLPSQQSIKSTRNNLS